MRKEETLRKIDNLCSCYISGRKVEGRRLSATDFSLLSTMRERVEKSAEDAEFFFNPYTLNFEKAGEPEKVQRTYLRKN